MNRPGFLEGVAVALVLALVGGLAHFALDLLFPAGLALRAVIAGISLGYLLYLLHRAPERVGRPTTLVLWVLMAVAVWPLAWSVQALTHLGALWLVRSLYFHGGFAAALADLMLNGLALAAALWAVERTGSLVVALWWFFLVQALFPLIPERRRADTPEAGPDRFEHAHRAAESALRRLYYTH